MAGPMKRQPWKDRMDPLARTYGKKVTLPRADIRAGVLGETIWPKVFEENGEIWKRLGGCEIKRNTVCPKGATFNFFPYAQDAVLEYPDTEEPSQSQEHTFGSTDPTKEPEEKRFPYVRRTAIKQRPTLLMFEVTGHVMLGLYFGNKPAQRAELHILNPWSMEGTQQIEDVFTLQTSTGIRMTVVDVAQRLEETKKIKKIDLQAGEKIGYCTLWVGILAREVINRIEALNTAVLSDTGTIAPGEGALEIYKEIYTGLAAKKTEKEQAVKDRLGDLFDCNDMAAAMAVLQLAIESAAIGKGRKTYRKRKHLSQTKKHRSRKSWKHRAL